VTLLEQAARDNAEWCEAVTRSHGIRSRFTADAWVAASRTPRSYPDAVTLRHSANRSLLREIDASDGCSVKDSFAALDLRADGFDVLLEARWIFRAPADEGTENAVQRAAADGDTLSWSVLDPRDLGAWAALHDDERVFRPSLLTEPGIVLLRADAGGRLTAAAALSHTGAVVGISNVVSLPGARRFAHTLWPGITDQVSRLFPGLAMVGYESGADLMAPLDAGFTEVGDLRIWSR
jgi:hypothetical protein